MKKWIINQNFLNKINTRALPAPDQKAAAKTAPTRGKSTRMSTLEALVVSYYNLAMNDFGNGAIAGASYRFDRF